jgi:hypothetical protein
MRDWMLLSRQLVVETFTAVSETSTAECLSILAKSYARSHRVLNMND